MLAKNVDTAVYKYDSGDDDGDVEIIENRSCLLYSMLRTIA